LNNIPIVDRFLELDIALQAVTEAGNAILDIYGRKYETSTKHDDSPITEADLKSNEIIKRILSKTNHQILSEEDTDDQSRLLQDVIWIVDPLDGTSDFIDQTGEFTVMIALVKNKKPILGVIGWPTEKTISSADSKTTGPW
jgi:3'(2'), 5'-bisphosphate nucleotidase